VAQVSGLSMVDFVPVRQLGVLECLEMVELGTSVYLATVEFGRVLLEVLASVEVALFVHVLQLGVQGFADCGHDCDCDVVVHTQVALALAC
jgi:hypothetical protein